MTYWDPTPCIHIGMILQPEQRSWSNATADLPSVHHAGWNPVNQEGLAFTGPSAGMLATAGGLVFKGMSNGIAAYDATNGTELGKSIDSQTGIVAAPVTYEHNGEQYLPLSRRAASNYMRLIIRAAGIQIGANGIAALNPVHAPSSIRAVHCQRGADDAGKYLPDNCISVTAMGQFRR